MDNYTVVLDFFKAAEKPVSAAQIAAGTGVDKKEVDKIMAKMKKEQLLVSPKNCFWELKK